MPLTHDQVQSIIVTERVTSVLSLVGTVFVIVTFLLNDRFRKPVNRLVFYATFGNILTNIGTLISTGGIEAGSGSPLCQFQAFLIQWFMPADALWSFAMAFNVYLSFFRSYDTAALRKLEWKYILACYGTPLVPAFAYFFIRTAERGKVYGPALLWCWVALDWDFLRVATFYGPVWIVILATVFIYVKVGIVIFKWRNHLLSLNHQASLYTHTSDYGPKQIVKTYEVTITSTGDSPENKREVNFSGDDELGLPKKSSPDGDRASFATTNRRQTMKQPPKPNRLDANKAALKYSKCAVLFFIALVITWVPSSINRIYTLFRPDDVVFGLNYAAALVLPLQGLWNAIIYFATSTFAVKALWQDILHVFKEKATTNKGGISNRMRREGHPLGPHERTQDSIKMTTPTYSMPISSDTELVGQAN